VRREGVGGGVAVIVIGRSDDADGDGWTGEGPFGQDITLKRGDW